MEKVHNQMKPAVKTDRSSLWIDKPPFPPYTESQTAKEKGEGKLRLSRTEKRHLLSYIFTAALPMLVCVALLLSRYALSGRADVRQRAMESLGYVRSQADLLFSRVESVGLHFSQNADMIEAFAETGEDRISGQLRTYEENYPSAGEIVFMLRCGSEIVTSSGVMPYGEFLRQRQTVDLNMSAFYTNMNGAKSPMFLQMRRSWQTQETSDTFVYIYPAPELAEKQMGCLAFFMDGAAFADLFADCMGETPGFYCILDSMMRQIYVSDHTAASSGLRERLLSARGTGMLSARVEGEGYLFLRLISQTNGYYYLAAIPESALYAGLNAAVARYLGVCAALFLVVVTAAVLVGRAFFRPLRELASDIDARDDDIFAGIRSQYARLSDQNAFLRDDAQRMQSLIRGPVLVELLMNGYSHTASLRSVLAGAGISFPHDGYFVVVCENTGGAPGAAVRAALDEIRLEKCALYPLEMAPEEEYALVVNMMVPPPEEQEARVRRVAGEILRQAQEAGAPGLRAGVGSISANLSDLGNSMIEAAVALREDDAQQVILYGARMQREIASALIPVQERAQLIEAALDGRRADAIAIFDGMCVAAREYSSNRTLALTWRLFLHGMFSELLEEMNLPGIGADSPLHSFSGTPLDQYCNIMRSALADAVTAYAPRQQKETAREKRILTYIRERFTDPDMSLEHVADTFGLSARSVTSAVRKATGMSFLQYVSSLRILYAKKLLAESDQRVKEIALAVGYLDAASFSRKFKQAEGVTPQEYRERGV